ARGRDAGAVGIDRSRGIDSYALATPDIDARVNPVWTKRDVDCACLITSVIKRTAVKLDAINVARSQENHLAGADRARRRIGGLASIGRIYCQGSVAVHLNRKAAIDEA